MKIMKLAKQPAFTADPHAGHQFIIDRLKRPFSDIDEQCHTLIQNWNNVQGEDDITFMIGDIWDTKGRNLDKCGEYLRQLNGKIYLIRGNHDDHLAKFEGRFEKWPTDMGGRQDWYKDTATISVPDDGHPHGHQHIVLSHFAMRTWNHSHYGNWHLYGHSHGKLADDPNALAFDVGVDVHDFTPLTYMDVNWIMFTTKLGNVQQAR